MMMDYWIKSVRDGWIDIPSPYLVDENENLEMDEVGQSIKALHGSHDDRVMAMQICCYCAHEMDWGNPKFSKDEKSATGQERVHSLAETDFSPIHDKNGIRRDAVQRGAARAEEILYEQIHEYDIPGSPDDDWKTRW